VFRRWSAAEKAIIDRAARLFEDNTRQGQPRIEREYIGDFLSLARQTHDERRLGYLMCFTASMAFEIVANHLRLNGMSLALLEPCFDNLADIFHRHGIPMRPVADEAMEAGAPEFEEALTAQLADVNAICLVTPNNPTGRVLAEDNLRRLARFCKDTGKLLILDNCFRAYLPRQLVHDQYRIVLETGADAVLIEDTGKTWPTSEIKAPFFAVTRAGGLYDRIYNIYTDFLLHVSPVGIRLTHEFVRLSQLDDLASIHRVVRDNRKALYESLAGTFLTPCERPFASISWLRIDHPMNGTDLHRALAQRGLFVLPGNQFFWHDGRKGEHFIRVALTRDPDMFGEAAALLRAVCCEIAGREGAEVPR
jgi:aspartate/methionine/tyrosine aminotransferase